MQLTNRVVIAVTRAALLLALGAWPGTGAASDQAERAGGAAADAAAPPCSNHTLRGDYGFVVSGTILGGPAPVLLRGVAMTHFDGEGGLTQVDFATMDGVAGWPNWRPATGTYEVNADCTGRALIVPAFGPPLDLRLVVFDQGRQVATIVLGNATGSLGTKR
jgi:hypothetical protein